MKLGFVGLGRMGSRMVLKLLSEGHEVVVWNRTKAKVDELKAEAKENWKLTTADSVVDLVSKLDSPKVVWSMLPAGEATESILAEISKHVSAGDVVIDGGNSKYTDTEKNYKEFKNKSVEFLGIGVSGGVVAFESGYPIMVGGSESGYETIKPILDSLAKPGGGHEYFGEGGAGHFVKMVHNAIEYGYMQSIGEGFGIMEKSIYNLDLLKVAKLYSKGTLLSGFFMDRAVEALSDDPKMQKIEGVIGSASEETEWAIDVAKQEMVPVDVIEKSFEFRLKSREDENVAATFAARMISAIRYAFGRHEVKKVERLTTND
ncbi:MAG TPA: NADP-dependent phosphogluconate dehydrogenase [Candidatus Saccharimonadales bacterium]|nr:NADP-dependent phosphogluconate dehydrogenase [Candidatus Saccharimonadales bacterium]